MAAVTGTRVAEFLGQGDDATLVALASEHAEITTAMARAYTRAGGFISGVPNEEIAAVITVAAARMVANPEQVATSVGVVSVRGGFSGWTLAEQIVLNRYRVRAQ